MTLVPGLFSHTLATTFSDARRDIEGMFARDVHGKLRAGIIYNSPAQLITARPDMSLNIGDFRAVQDRGGAVPFANQGEAITPAFDAAPSANRRIDTLIVTQEIPELGDAGSAPIFEIIKGNPSATPIAPPLPANRSDALIMCDVEIPAGATSMQSAGIIITPRFLYTAMAGGTVYVRNSVEMAAWTPADGSRVLSLADNGEYVRTSGAWIGGILSLADAGGSLSTGWTNSPAPNAVRIYREPRRRTLYGSIKHGTGSLYASMLKLGSLDMPPTISDVRLIGSTFVHKNDINDGVPIVLALNADGTVRLSTGSQSMVAGSVVRLDGISWLID